MSTRSMISSKKLRTEIGYVEGSEAFDLRGRKRCIYEPATGNLLAFDSGKIVGHVSLAGNFIGLSWLADELFPHLNDQPNIASGTPIKATVSIIRSTALAEKSQLNIVRDERAEAADKGSAAHTSAASLQRSTDVNLTLRRGVFGMTALALCITASSVLTEEKEDVHRLDVQQLYRQCTKPLEDVEEAFCVGFISGVGEHMRANGFLLKALTNEADRRTFLFMSA